MQVRSDAVFHFDGRVAVVTGGSQGIGFAIAKAFSEAGAKVAVCDIHAQKAAEAAEKLKKNGGIAAAVTMDVSDSESVNTGMQEVLRFSGGRIDFLINNAGLNNKGLVENLSDEDWNRVVNVDMTGTFYCTRAVMPVMKKQMYGRIINIASMSGVKMGYLGSSAYTAAKAGQIAFARHVAMEGAIYGITVNSVCPGSTMTSLHIGFTPPEVVKRKSEANPTGRLGKPEDQVNAVLFFASDLASYITGQYLIVDGGAMNSFMDSYSYHRELDPGFDEAAVRAFHDSDMGELRNFQRQV